MATLQDIRRRITSTQNTKKITKAMEMVAAAKLRRAQQRIEALRPYAIDMVENDVGGGFGARLADNAGLGGVGVGRLLRVDHLELCVSDVDAELGELDCQFELFIGA